MTGEYRRAIGSLQSLLGQHSPAELLARLRRKHARWRHKFVRALKSQTLPSKHVGSVCRCPTPRVASFWTLKVTRKRAVIQPTLRTSLARSKCPLASLGVTRPAGTYAQQDRIVPLATTEATLVASYGRGAKLITAVGGCSALIVNEGMARSPGFAFQALYEAGQFAAWVLAAFPDLAAVGAATSGYARLQDVRVSIEGNHVYVIFTFHTGDAAGQNMVTIATQAICAHINLHSPVKPAYYFLGESFRR